MGRSLFEKYNTTAQECYEYEPIQDIKQLAPVFDEIETDEECCDSCIHYNNPACDVFKKEN